MSLVIVRDKCANSNVIVITIAIASARNWATQLTAVVIAAVVIAAIIIIVVVVALKRKMVDGIIVIMRC